MYVCIYVSYVSMYVCMHACMYVFTYVHMHAFMHVYMHACMHACMHLCMHVNIHMYSGIRTNSHGRQGETSTPRRQTGRNSSNVIFPINLLRKPQRTSPFDILFFQAKIDAARKEIEDAENAKNNAMAGYNEHIEAAKARVGAEATDGVLLRLRCPDGLQLTRKFAKDDKVPIHPSIYMSR